MYRYPAFFLLVVFLSGATTLLADEPVEPPWEYKGLAGTEIHNVHVMSGGIYIGAEDGLHIMQMSDGAWRDLDREGVAGWPVTAIGRSPDYPSHVITGRVDGDGFGALATTDISDGTTVLHLGLQPGSFTRIGNNGEAGGYAVWACTPGVGVPGVLLESIDGGVLWDTVTGHGINAPMSFSFSTIMVSDVDIPYAYLAGEGGIRSTLDGGLNWNPVDEGLPTSPVRDVSLRIVSGYGIPDIDKQDTVSHWFFAATDSGLYFKAVEDSLWSLALDEPCTKVRSTMMHDHSGFVFALTSAGQLFCTQLNTMYWWAWQDWATGLSAYEITDFDLIGFRLFVGTHDDGLFEKNFENTDVPSAERLVELKVAPNPFNPATILSFEAPRSGHAHLAIFDLRGRCIDVLLDEDIAAGPVSRSWHPSDPPSGVYLARLQLNDVTSMCRVALIR
jgi:hypothetical protein